MCSCGVSEIDAHKNLVRMNVLRSSVTYIEYIKNQMKIALQKSISKYETLNNTNN